MDINKNDSRNTGPHHEMKSYVARSATLPGGNRYDSMAKNGLFGWKDRIICYRCGNGSRVCDFTGNTCKICKK